MRLKFMTTEDIPELIVLETRPRGSLKVETIYFTQCQPHWDDETDLINQLVKFGLLYTLPLLFITVTYFQIVRVLRRSARMVHHPHKANGEDGSQSAGLFNSIFKSIKSISGYSQVQL